MRDSRKTKAQLIEELESLRARVVELERERGEPEAAREQRQPGPQELKGDGDRVPSPGSEESEARGFSQCRSVRSEDRTPAEVLCAAPTGLADTVARLCRRLGHRPTCVTERRGLKQVRGKFALAMVTDDAGLDSPFSAATLIELASGQYDAITTQRRLLLGVMDVQTGLQRSYVHYGSSYCRVELDRGVLTRDGAGAVHEAIIDTLSMPPYERVDYYDYVTTHDLHCLVESSQAPLIVLDRDWRVWFANVAAQAVFKRPTHLMKGLPAADLLSSKDLARRFQELVQEHLRVGGGKAELRMRARDGTEFDALVAYNRVFDAGPEDLRAFTLHDITDRKRAEGELQRHRYHLEELVEARTAELRATNESLHREITERKRTEEKLRFTQFSIDHTTEAAFWIGPDARFAYINEAACRALGYTREELLSMSVHDIDPNYPEDVWPEHWRDLRQRRSLTLESCHRTKSGRTFPVEITVNYLQYDGREYNFAFARDITERKRSEEALRRERDFNKRLIQASPAFIVSISRDGKTLMMNDAMLQALGYTAEEVVGKDYLSTFVPEADREMLSDIFKQLVGSGESTLNENRVMTRDGRELLVEWHGKQVLDASGEVEYFFGVGIDITERKRAEELLRVKDHAIASSVTPMVLGDLEGRISYANRAFLELWGYDREEEVVGRMNTELAFSANDVRQIMEAVRTRGSWIGESTARRKDGTPFDIQLSVATVADSHGTALCTMASFLDITDRTRAEQAERMAEVGNLASGLVHEVRNPLNAMRMQIAVIRNKFKHPHDENMKTAIAQLERLEHEVLRVQQLANDFLAYGRPVSDNPETVELPRVIADVAEFVKPEFEHIGARVELTVGADAGSLTVRMDLSKLRQVLLNLAENARQAITGGGKLTLSCDRPSSHEARIRVCDTGCGIPPEKLPRVFEAFYSTRHEGTGLGLAIVKRTVEAAGGRVRVESEVDRGTRFEIYLPLAIEIAPARSDSEPAAR